MLTHFKSWLCLVAGLSSAAFATEQDSIGHAIKRLQAVHHSLYNEIDIRKLAAEDLPKYLSALRELDITTQDLKRFSCGPQQEVFLTYEESVSVPAPWLGCLALSEEQRKLLADGFAETSIRRCLAERHRQCTVERPARVRSLTNHDSAQHMQCIVEMDIVLKASR